MKNILTGNIVTVHCNTENKDYGPFALKDGTFTVSSVAGDAANGYTCTVTITDVDKYITEVGNGHTADTQTAENTVTLKSTDGKTWAKADANASFKLYAKCDGTQPPLDSEPKYEELKPLLDQKIKVEDKVKTGYQHHDTESFDLIADSYDMTKDNNGQVTLTIKAEKYVAAYNDKHAGHALVKGTVDSVQLTLEKSGDEWSIVDGKTPVTFEVECNELIPPTQPTNADLDSQTLQIKCNTDQNHPIETVPYSQGDYTINWKQGDTRCTVTFTLDKYVKYYSDLHGAHTAVANQTVTKGFHFVNGAWKADDTPRPEILVECQPSVAPTTKPDWTSYMVQVMCLTDGDSAEQYVANKPGSKKWFTESGIVKDANGDYTYTITINKQAYIDNFVKNRTAHGEVDGSTSNVITWKWVNNAWVCQTPDVAGASAGTKVRINVKCVLAPDWSGKYLVQVKCLNEQNTSVEYYITKSSATKPWVTESGIVSDGKGGYTYTITVNKQAYIDKFVKTYGPHAEADGSSNVITLKWENGDWVCTTPTVQSGTDPNTKALINVKCLYTVTFDADGGTPTPDAQTVMHGGFATAPTAPTKTGYEFKGWFEDGAAEAFNFGTKVILKNTKLTAKWEPTQYTITYVLNDKDAKHTNPTTYTVEDEFTITDATNGSFGRKFLEWRDADSKTGNKVSKIVKGTTDNITLYAIWQNPVNYFQVDKDGNKTLIRTDYVTVHEDYQTIAAIDKAGYTFDGWYKSTKDFGADSKKVADFTATNDKAEWKLFGRYIPNTNTPYVVEHYQEQLDGTYKLVETQNLAGTTDTTATAKAKKYDHFTYDSSVDGTLVSGNIAGDGSLVLKLYYTRNIYTVTFESNGGSAINSRKVKYEQTLADVDPIGSSFVPTKSGNTFAGWYTDKKLKNAFTFDTGITGSMTLYAKWDPAKAVNTTTPGGNNIGPAKNPYIKDTTKTDGKTVKSGNTFDAGIALYAGLGFLALTGSAVAIFKQRREYGA